MRRLDIAIRRVDGQPLTRVDLQYDFLKNVFNDTTCVFTDPYSENASSKICFRDLYVKAIIHSTKATNALKERLAESPLFGTDFAMLSLLVNIGRINTTMSFFPEMKTNIRTYHPVPALQRTSGSLHDGPRIKHLLQASVFGMLPIDLPRSPEAILARLRSKLSPPTSAPHVISVLADYTYHIGKTHFSEQLDFIDLFVRTDVSSLSRARAFLWVCYNYLENLSTDDDYDEESVPNPFADQRLVNEPSFCLLTPEEIALENVDSEEEKTLAEKLIAQRDHIVKAQAAKETIKETIGEDDEMVPSPAEDKLKRKGKARAFDWGTRIAAAKERKAAADKRRRERIKQKAKGEEAVSYLEKSKPGDGDCDAVTPTSEPLLNDLRANSYSSAQRSSSCRRSPEPSLPFHHQYSSHSHDVMHGKIIPRGEPYPSHRLRIIPDRTTLQHAWHVVTTRDPLLDSDDEHGNEYDRRDYVQRLKIVSHLSHQRWYEHKSDSFPDKYSEWET